MNNQFESSILFKKIINIPTDIYVNRNINYLERIKSKISDVLNSSPESFYDDEDDNYSFKIIADNLVLDVYDHIFKNKSMHLSKSAINILSNIIQELNPDEKQQSIKTYLPPEVSVKTGGGRINSNQIMQLIKKHKMFINLLIDYFHNL